MIDPRCLGGSVADNVRPHGHTLRTEIDWTDIDGRLKALAVGQERESHTGGRPVQPLTGRHITSALVATTVSPRPAQSSSGPSARALMPNVHEDAPPLTCSDTRSPGVLVASLVASASGSVAPPRGAQGPRSSAVRIRYGLRLPRVVAGQGAVAFDSSRTFKRLSCVFLREPRVPSARVGQPAQCVREPHPPVTSPLPPALRPISPEPAWRTLSRTQGHGVAPGGESEPPRRCWLPALPGSAESGPRIPPIKGGQ
jgi:hypothetical protein